MLKSASFTGQKSDTRLTLYASDFFFFLQLLNQLNLLIVMRSERINANPQCSSCPLGGSTAALEFPQKKNELVNINHTDDLFSTIMAPELPPESV